jgi:hypothetical protein
MPLAGTPLGGATLDGPVEVDDENDIGVRKGGGNEDELGGYIDALGGGNDAPGGASSWRPRSNTGSTVAQSSSDSRAES